MKNLENIEKLEFGARNVATGSTGILRNPIFTGSYRNARFSHFEYYEVKIVNNNYDYNKGYHRFTCEVLAVIKGDKKVGAKFTKRGKNLYPNYYEEIYASQEAFEEKAEKKRVRDNQKEMKVII